MNFRYVQGEVALEDAFASPRFELVETRVAVLRTIFETLQPIFPVDPRGLRVLAADNLSEPLVLVNAIEGVAKVEISPVLMRLAVGPLFQLAFWDAGNQWIELVETAIRQHFPVDTVTTRTVRRYVHLSADDIDIGKYLGELVSEKGRIEPTLLQAEECSYGLQLRLRGAGKSTEIGIEKSLLQNASLFVAGVFTYEGPVRDAKESLIDSDRQMRTLLSAYGVEFE